MSKFNVSMLLVLYRYLLNQAPLLVGALIATGKLSDKQGKYALRIVEAMKVINL